MQILTLAHRTKTGSRVALVLLLFCLAGAGVLLTLLRLRMEEQSILDRTAAELTQAAQTRVTAVAAWYQGVERKLNDFSHQDMLRLFVDGLSPSAPSGMEGNIAEPAPLSDIVSAHSLPALRSLLGTLLSPPLTGIELLSPDGVCLVHLDEYGTRRHRDSAFLHKAADKIRNGGAMQLSPVHLSPRDNSIITLILPVQGYADQGQAQKRGMLLATLRLSRAVALATLPRDGQPSSIATRLMHTLPASGTHPAVMEEVKAGSLSPFPDWFCEPDGHSPTKRRTLPDGLAVYALSLPVPPLPLAVSADIPASLVQEHLEKARRSIMLQMALLTLGICALAGFLWWRLVGRHASAAGRELEMLHHRVERQNELIASIAAALHDGLVVQNRLGQIIYVNTAFEAILGRQAADLMRSTPESALLTIRGERFDTHWKEVLHSDKPRTFILDLALSDSKDTEERRSIQISTETFCREDGSAAGVFSLCRDVTDLLRAQKARQTLLWKTVKALSLSIEAADPYLRGQSEYTGELALLMARRLNWSQEKLDTLHISASLFQLGMLRLPHGLLDKKGPLSPAERLQLQQHVRYTTEMLADVDFGLPVRTVISQMSERMDGSGYPEGLRGEAILPEARLLAVANAFCALMRPRAYREARTEEEALRILDASSAQYDALFLRILKDVLAGEGSRAFIAHLQKN